ncbi:MAG TPA: hypothetical protein VJZ04_09330 [Lachnospiraceae bacterium]|nr:hypothetical protein [Lachnospiraceae bacterium]
MDNQQNKITTKGKIASIIVLLDQYAILLMRDKKKLANNLMPEITGLLSEIIPAIVMSYELEALKHMQQDMEYWLNQISRITEAIQGKDAFLKIDVLYFETRENLILYMDMIEELGVTL